MCTGCLLGDKHCDYTQTDTTQMLPVRCYCQARHLYGSGAVPSSRVRRPPASVSPGQLAQWADPQVSSKDNQIWLFLFVHHKIIYSEKYCHLNLRNYCLSECTMNTTWKQTYFLFWFGFLFFSLNNSSHSSLYK